MSDPFGGWNPGGAGTAAKGPSSSDPFGGWQGAGAAAAPGGSPFAGADVQGAANTGGGGGLLGRALGDVGQIVTGLPKGVEAVTRDVGLAGARGTENLVNDVAFGVTHGLHNVGIPAPLTGGARDTHLGGLSGTPDYSTHTGRVGLGIDTLAPHLSDVATRVRTAYPALEGIRAGTVQTGIHAQGLGQLAAGGEVGHPLLGSGAERRLISDYSQHPIASLLNDAVNVAIVGGGAANVAGAPAEYAAGAGVEPGVAAARLGAAGEAVGRGGELAGHVAGAPFRVPGLLARGVGAIPGVSDAAAALAARAGEAPIVSSIAERRTLAEARGQVAPIQATTRDIPLADFRAAAQREAAQREAATVDRLVPNPVEQGAAILNAQGLFDAPGAAERMSRVLADPARRAVLDAHLAETARGNPEAFTPTTAMYEAAVGDRLGLSDRATASRLATAENFVRGLSEQRGELAKAQGVGPESFQGPTPMLAKLADSKLGVGKLADVARRTQYAAEALRERADALNAAADREVPVATGNSGQAGQERAALVNDRARTALERLRQRGEHGAQQIVDGAVQRISAEADPALQLERLRAEQDAARQAHVAAHGRFVADNADLIARENAAAAASRDAARTGLPDPVATLDALAAGVPGRQLADVAQEAPYNQAGEQAATAEEAAARAGHDAATAEAVRTQRAAIRASIAREYSNLTDTLDAALQAGGPLGPKGTGGEWDAFRDMNPTTYAKIRAGDISGTGAAGLADVVKGGPDQWAQAAARALGLDPNTPVDEVVRQVVQLDRAIRDLGKARQSQQGIVDWLGRNTPVDEHTDPALTADYHRNLMAGSPEDAARTMMRAGQVRSFDEQAAQEARARGYANAPEPPTVSDRTAVENALAQRPMPPDVATEATQVLSGHVGALSAQLHDALARAREGLPPLRTPAELKAEALARATAAIPAEGRLAAVETSARANAWVHVRDALGTDADAADAGMKGQRPVLFGTEAKASAARPGYDALSKNEQAMYRQQVGEDYATRTGRELRDARAKVQTTFIERGRTAGLAQGFRQGKAAVAERVASLAERRATAAAGRLGEAANAGLDNPRYAPAPYRPALESYRGFTRAFADEATARAKAGDTAGAAAMEGVARDLEQLGHLQTFQAEGVTQPSHLIGANKAGFQREAETTGPSLGRGPARATRAGATYERRGNLTPLTVGGQVAGEVARYAQYARTNFANALDRNLGVDSSAVLGDTANLNGKQIAAAMRDQGFTPWRPGTGIITSDLEVTPATRFLPDAVAKVADVRTGFDPIKTGPLGVSVDFLTRTLYKTPLQLSPFYWAHRIGSDVALAATHGMSLADIVRYGTEAAKVVARGDTPGSLRGGLLDEARQGGIANKLTAVPRTVDEMTRVAMYLKNLDQGASHVEAVRMANDALGHLNNLGPIEQSVVRRIFPVYPWLKQVAQTAVTLGEEHPAAALFTLNAGQQAAARNDQGLPAWLQGFDPLRLLTIQPGALVNPLARAAAGVLTGYNLAAGRMVSTAKTAANPYGEAGPITSAKRLGLHGALYFAGHQLPLTHLAEDTRIPGTNRTLTNQTPRLDRFDTGELRLNPRTGQTQPQITPPYLRQFLGSPGSLEPKPPAAVAKSNKAKAAAVRAEAKRQRQLATLGRKGVR